MISNSEDRKGDRHRRHERERRGGERRRQMSWKGEMKAGKKKKSLLEWELIKPVVPARQLKHMRGNFLSRHTLSPVNEAVCLEVSFTSCLPAPGRERGVCSTVSL